MADVEIVTTFAQFNIYQRKVEDLLHCVFERARLKIEIKDRFGHPVTPRDWFLVPFSAIDEAVERIRDGSIKRLVSDPSKAQLVGRSRCSTYFNGIQDTRFSEN